MTQVKRAVKTEDFTKLNIYSDPQFSPTKEGFAFVSTVTNNNEYKSSLNYYNLSTKAHSKWTYSNTKDTQPRFSPKGNKLAFQSTRSGRPQIWLMSTEGGEANQLTTFTYGATNPEWSKDGRFIIFSAMLHQDADVESQKELSEEAYAEERKHRSEQPLIVNKLKYKSDARGFHDDKYGQLVMYDIEKDSFSQLTFDPVNHQFEDISPDGQYVLFSTNLNEQADREQKSYLYTVHTTTKEIEQLTKTEGVFGTAKYSPSGNYIAYLGHELAYKGATLNELYILNIATKERTCLSESWDFALGDYMIGDTRMGSAFTGPQWSADEESIFFIGTRNGSTGLFATSLEGQLESLYEKDQHIFSFSYNDTDETFVLGISTSTNPGDFYLFKRKESNQLQQLTYANKTYLEEVALSEPETLTITAEDGWDIQGWLLKPYNFTEGKKYPFVLEVHGGPHAMYGQTYFHEMQLLAAQGYVVLYTNPRGSHGYGQAFVDAVRGDYGGKDYTDLMAAVDHVLEKYSFIDEERLGVTGGSYGGFMTNWIVGHTDRFKAAVTQRSISNWLSFYGVSDIGHFFTEWELEVDLFEDPKKLWEFSPLKYVENVETPLLILHGELDFRCPVEQAEQLFIALKTLNKDVELVRFPNANHELSRSGEPKMRIERLNHICRWFEKYL